MATTLFDVTLDLARQARGVTRYKVTAVSGKMLRSSRMGNRMGEYLNGTMWVMTGESKGQFSRIKSAKDDYIIPEDDTLDIAAGDVIMICQWIDFNLDDLIEAINSVLYRYPIYAWDNSLTWNSDQLVYDLPDGVSDIRQVYVANTLDNGTFTLSHCWQEENKQLRFHEIDPTVDLIYLRNMAFLYLWRTVIIIQHKDNPIAADMYNEAKMYESEHQKFNLPERNIPLRSFFTR